MHAHPKQRETHWKTLVLSDLHIGSRHLKYRQALDFLQKNSAETLILNGDIIDIRVLEKTTRFLVMHKHLIRELLAVATKSETFYVTGNHDQDAALIGGIVGGNVKMLREMIYHTVTGKKILITHGDIFDAGLRSSISPWKVRAITRCYYFVLSLDALSQKNFGWGSILSSIKRRSVKWQRYVTGFKNAALHYACKHDVDFIICGHIHVPEFCIKLERAYLNSGDWVEHSTALVEDFDGRWYLLDASGKQLDSLDV